MRITLEQQGTNNLFVGTNESGNQTKFHVPEAGEKKLAPGPMETLLMALPACACCDVRAILTKMRQNLKHLKVDVEGKREKKGDTKPYKKIHMHFILHGEINASKAGRAIDLSVNKYCSVAQSLDPEIKITSSFEILD